MPIPSWLFKPLDVNHDAASEVTFVLSRAVDVNLAFAWIVVEMGFAASLVYSEPVTPRPRAEKPIATHSPLAGLPELLRMTLMVIIETSLLEWNYC